MDETTLDRRQRRSRVALRNALLALISEQSYESITIDHIVERADIVRATFYAHYRDKADLLRELTDELISEAADRARRSDPAATPGSYSGRSASEIIAHAGEHPDLYRLVMSGAGGPEPRRQLFETLRQAVDDIFTAVSKRQEAILRVPMSMTATAYTGALLAVIEDWLDGPPKKTPSQVAAVFMHGQVEGLRWALGLPSSSLVYEEPKSSPDG